MFLFDVFTLMFVSCLFHASERHDRSIRHQIRSSDTTISLDTFARVDKTLAEVK